MIALSELKPGHLKQRQITFLNIMLTQKMKALMITAIILTVLYCVGSMIKTFPKAMMTNNPTQIIVFTIRLPTMNIFTLFCAELSS